MAARKSIVLIILVFRINRLQFVFYNLAHEGSNVADARKDKRQTYSDVDYRQIGFGDRHMSQQLPHGNHQRYHYITLPGYKRENTFRTFHGQYASQIFIHDLQKSKMVYHKCHCNAYGAKYKWPVDMKCIQPEKWLKQKHCSNTKPHEAGKKQQYLLIYGWFNIGYSLFHSINALNFPMIWISARFFGSNSNLTGYKVYLFSILYNILYFYININTDNISIK